MKTADIEDRAAGRLRDYAGGLHLERSAQPSTKGKIVDAAELLFGARGLDNVSVRNIAAAAAVSLSAISFHFQSKENLIKVVLARRLLPLAERRSANLRKLLGASPQPSARDILLAFLEPLFEMQRSTDAGKRAFLRILSQTLIYPSAEYREILTDQLAPHLAGYTDALCVAIPGLSREELTNRLDFMVGAVGHAFSDSTRRLAHKAKSSTSVKRLIPQLVAFVVAGCEAAPALAEM